MTPRTFQPVNLINPLDEHGPGLARAAGGWGVVVNALTPGPSP